MMSSGNLADIIGYVDASSLEKLGRDGGMIPLNDLIKEHAPNIQKVLDEDARFRQTAYAITTRLVGSEMCIRDRAKVGYFRIDSFGEASRIKAPDFSLIGTIRKGVPGMILARLMSAGTRRRGKEHSLSGTPVADCRTRF